MSDIPPPATSLVHQAPAVPLTSFVGREPEVDLVTALLARPDVRLLTLTGPGGIGKTRLALQIAADLAHVFPGGVAVVPLASIRDPDLVPATVAQILGVPAAPGQPLPTRLQTFLHDRDLLLVLDNAEHLLDATASLVAQLLLQCPRLTVLATSRTRLGISGEQVVPLDPLGPEAARQLFEVRAQAVMPTFALAEELSPTIDAICARLDCLPLAVELAAARVKVLPPRALLARLDHQLDLLTGGPRDAPPRQRTMRDAIAWSHELLSEQEQRLFRQLGVFVDGFTLEAAQAVTGEGNDVLAGVSALVEASLVIPMHGVEDEPRFTMLETIREYALEQLAASGEEVTLRDRHVLWALALAQSTRARANTLEQALAANRLVPEQPNIEAALRWLHEREQGEALVDLVNALDFYWQFTQPTVPALRWYERALAYSTDLPSKRLDLLNSAGPLAHQMESPLADPYIAELSPLAEEIGTISQRANAAYVTALRAEDQGDYPRAETGFLSA
ncbi:MAG TPA: AAA family ATPase [Chloroflexota bacterium]|nr:AAA family ATPase [Chloroflexota bacterium]